MRGRSTHTRTGFTLMELLITAGLSAGLAMATAHFWRYFSYQLKDLNARARVAQELRLAVDGITRDMGPAVGATPVGTDQVMICQDGGDIPDGLAGWGEPDRLVIYSLVGGQLLREDQSSGVEIVIADGVSTFIVEDVTPSVMRISVTVSRDGISRGVKLIWSRP